jgi:hypothetical protein
MKTYYIYINAECTEKRAAALVGGLWMFEQANGEWMPFPESEYVIYEDTH